jgi:hypothetical protein
MRVGGDQQPRGVDAAVIEALQLVEQHTGIDHHTIADDVGDAGRQHARRDEMQSEVLAAGQYHGVPGIVAPLIAHHPLGAPTE